MRANLKKKKSLTSFEFAFYRTLTINIGALHCCISTETIGCNTCKYLYINNLQNTCNETSSLKFFVFFLFRIYLHYNFASEIETKIINNQILKVMKELNLNKQVANRLQDEEMANLVGAASESKSTIINKDQMAVGRDIEDDNDSGFTSCCKKSCK